MEAAVLEAGQPLARTVELGHQHMMPAAARGVRRGYRAGLPRLVPGELFVLDGKALVERPRIELAMGPGRSAHPGG
jgi:hypothetical protein